MTSPLTIVHRVSIPLAASHLVHVETTITDARGPWAEPLVLFMPVWTPGSYLVREYARHVEGFEVHVAGEEAAGPGPADGRRGTKPLVGPRIEVAKVRKNAWLVHAAGSSSIVVRYRVYAGELTVRTSHVDETHAFLVPASIFLGVHGHPDAPITVVVEAPPGWRVATPLPRHPSATDAHTFAAPDFDALVDAPIECGAPGDRSFDVLGRPHRYAVCPADAISAADWTRLVQDTATIVETEARLFGGELPYASYDFILHLSARSRGGLEHADGAALVAPPTSFATREGYLDLLSLVAHELFHAWNVKRIRPEGLTPYRYEHECYTRLLWWFEGATSYYDWRVLVLARLCTVDEYLDHLGAEIANLDQTYGRWVQSLEDASFDAWIKLYRPDENTTNSAVSYYRKGEIVAALLDLELRARSDGRATLDAVLRHLWTEYGIRGKPVPEDGMQAIVERATSVPVGDLFDAWIRRPGELDYARTLAHVGLSLERTARPDAPPCSLGLRTRAEAGRVLVASIARDSGASNAGVQAGDELVAVGGARVESPAVETVLRARAPGESIELVLSREGRVLARTATLDPPRPDRVKLVIARDATAAAREAFTAWLGQPVPGRGRGSS